jgi:diguanylate cyclase (GGDEF)-like protein
LVPRNLKFWGATVVVLSLLQAAVAFLVPKGSALTLSSESIDVALHIAASLAFLYNARTSSGRVSIFWYLQAACWGTLTVTSSLWMYYGVVLHQEVPTAFVGDIYLFLAGVPMLAGLLLRPDRRSNHDARLSFLDLPLLVLWWLFLYFFFVTPWQYVVPNEARYGPTYNTLLLAQDLVSIGLLTLLWQDTFGKWKRFYLVLLGAEVMSAGAAYLANRAIDANAYYPGSWYDVLIDAAVAWFALSALLGNGLAPEARSEEHPDQKAGRWMTRVAMVAVFSIPALAAWSLLTGTAPPAVTKFRVLVALGMITIMGCLIFLKQHGLRQELAKTNHILHEASLTDPLTGCRNRRYFDSTIEADVSHVQRCFIDNRDESRRDLIFYFIDADHFKDVNDRYGHDAGDKVLVEMARRISSAIRLSDILVRWGGEEFLVISRYTDRTEGDTLASRLLSSIACRPFIAGDQENSVNLTCSVGWAAFPWLTDKPDAFSYAEVLALADRALYDAKQAGRNCAVGSRSSGKCMTNPAAGKVPVPTS